MKRLLLIRVPSRGDGKVFLKTRLREEWCHRFGHKPKLDDHDYLYCARCGDTLLP